MSILSSKFHYATLIALLLLLFISAGVYFNALSGFWLLALTVSYIMLLVLGSIFIQWNFYLRSYNKLDAFFPNGRAEKPRHDAKLSIAITFDDGPADYTGEILDILKMHEVPATFFLIGKNIKGKESVVARMHQEGHAIGSHSYYHGFNFDWQSASAMEEEIRAANKAIGQITGTQIGLFRPPYGVTNPNLAKAIGKTGMISVGWNLRSMDTIARDEKDLMERILRQLKSGSIILLHDSCAITARILPDLLQAIKARGYTAIAL